MIVLVVKYFTPKGFRGITIFPFIFLKNKKDRADVVILNHEMIHIRQQAELLVLPFFIWYGIEYLFRLLKYRNRSLAYRNISFEKEAYANEGNLAYLKTRTVWRFWNYM